MLKIADYLSEGTARTLLMPLCCCGTASRLNPEGGIYDARAAEVLRQVDYDFTRLRRASIEYTVLCCLLREWHHRMSRLKLSLKSVERCFRELTVLDINLLGISVDRKSVV